MNPKPRPAVGPYLVAVACVGAATVMTCNWPLLYNIHSLAIFLVGVLVSAFYGGLMPSLVAIALSVLPSIILSPPRRVGESVEPCQDWVRLGSFVAVSFFFSVLHAQRVKAEEKVRSMARCRSDTRIGWHEGRRMGFGSGDRDHLAFGESGRTFRPRPGAALPILTESFLGYVHAEDRDFVHRTVTRAASKKPPWNTTISISHCLARRRLALGSPPAR